MLTIDQISEIEFFGKAEIDGCNYTYKDYLYKSEIRKDGVLFARIDNRKAVDDSTRIEYVYQGCGGR